MINIITIFTIFTVSSLFSQNLHNIAVNRLTPKGISLNEAIPLTDALRSELGKTGKFKVMERAKMDEILTEQGFQQSGACDESACALEMGKLLGVDLIVVGNIGRVGKTYTINIRLVNVGTGEILKDISEYHKGAKDDLLTETVPIAAKKLAGTYKKSRKKIYWIAGGVATVFVAAGTATYLFTRDKKEEESETTVKVKW